MLEKSFLILVVVPEICHSKAEMLQKFIPQEPPAMIIFIEVRDVEDALDGQPFDLSGVHSHTGTVFFVEFILSWRRRSVQCKIKLKSN